MNRTPTNLLARLRRFPRPGDLLRRGGREAMRGMTLIEIMVVVAIIGIITAAVAFAVIPRFRRAQKNVTRIAVEKTHAAATEYYVTAGRCPSAETLADEELITGGQKKDQWGTLLQITCDGDLIEVRSAGPDQSMGNDDDIFFNGNDEEEDR
jgi:prepilin-type N-terminal cleavage/methylation domain-containing protein